MTTLYLLIRAPSAGAGRGVMWLGDNTQPHDPDHGADLVGLDQTMDAWNGSEILVSVDPWLLASAALCDAIAAAGLTGLHLGLVANTFYSPEANRLASLGELASKAIPEFRIVLPRSVIEVAPLYSHSDGAWSHDDDLRYSGWSGDDFSRSARGQPVLSPRAVELVRRHRNDGCEFWTVRPR